ncbi:recombinase family protein [Streptomyces hydrogenans]|uniref:Resolvase/invertase-type recombinase catalytic domain-containing protein n=1 Tax=Streptomyces hydrogenans TaxID=1873719 RepID=A0ABQ3PJU7_9ACTN|nr:recombinase family protein [Streptomyces hydrogenans]GHG09532.1 hypothetical protein GCM10018784_22570 [Streptomyces hydrogenans]GHI25292.1 hypothetical protein Shyd_66630 [Streptomyces hydrogenans]
MDKSGIYDIYARISMAPDGSLEKTDRQIGDAEAEAKRRDITVGRILQDPNKSAWRRNVRRPDWEALIERFEAGITDGCIVWNVDRLMRQPRDLERLIDMAESSRGYEVISCFGSYDLTNPDDRFRLRIETAAAEREVSATSRRQKRKIEASRKAGIMPGGLRRFGFQGKGDQAVPEEQVQREREYLAQAVHDHVHDGKTFAQIQIEWREAGLTGSYGREFDGFANIGKILTRPINAGLITHKGVVVARRPDLAIVSEEDHEMICAMRAGRSRGPQRRRMLTNIAQCELCGQGMTGTLLSAGNGRNADGSRRSSPAYRCDRRQGCGQVSILEAPLVEFIGRFVIARLTDPAHAARIAEVEAGMRETEAEVSRLEELVELFDQKLLRGAMTLERYEKATASVERRLLQLREGMEVVPASSPRVPRAVQAIKSAWINGSIDVQREMVRYALGSRRLVVGKTDKRIRNASYYESRIHIV